MQHKQTKSIIIFVIISSIYFINYTFIPKLFRINPIKKDLHLHYLDYKISFNKTLTHMNYCINPIRHPILVKKIGDNINKGLRFPNVYNIDSFIMNVICPQYKMQNKNIYNGIEEFITETFAGSFVMTAVEFDNNNNSKGFYKIVFDLSKDDLNLYKKDKSYEISQRYLDKNFRIVDSSKEKFYFENLDNKNDNIDFDFVYHKANEKFLKYRNIKKNKYKYYNKLLYSIYIPNEQHIDLGKDVNLVKLPYFIDLIN